MSDIESKSIHEYYGIHLTATAKSKCFRLLGHSELYRAVRDLDGVLYRRSGTDRDEYHLIHDDTVLVLVVEPDDAELVVVTQMHIHNDYPNDSRFERVDGLTI